MIKRQSTDQEKTFANRISNKGLVYTKKISKLNNNKQAIYSKWTKNTNRDFTKENMHRKYQDTKIHHLVIGEIQRSYNEISLHFYQSVYKKQ